jgi:hypothetical protein
MLLIGTSGMSGELTSGFSNILFVFDKYQVGEAWLFVVLQPEI